MTVTPHQPAHVVDITCAIETSGRAVAHQSRGEGGRVGVPRGRGEGGQPARLRERVGIEEGDPLAVIESRDREIVGAGETSVLRAGQDTRAADRVRRGASGSVSRAVRAPIIDQDDAFGTSRLSGDRGETALDIAAASNVTMTRPIVRWDPHSRRCAGGRRSGSDRRAACGARRRRQALDVRIHHHPHEAAEVHLRLPARAPISPWRGFR